MAVQFVLLIIHIYIYILSLSLHIHTHTHTHIYIERVVLMNWHWLPGPSGAVKNLFCCFPHWHWLETTAVLKDLRQSHSIQSKSAPIIYRVYCNSFNNSLEWTNHIIVLKSNWLKVHQRSLIDYSVNHLTYKRYFPCSLGCHWLTELCGTTQVAIPF